MASFIAAPVDSGNRATYTFSSITFPAGRVAVFVRVQAGTGVSLGSVTINGVTATEDLDGSFSTNNPGKWFSAVVSSGTGSVVVTMSGGSGNRAAIGVYNVVGTTYATGTVDDTSNPSVVDTNTLAGDVALCCSYVFGAGVTYTGNANLPNEDFDGQIEGSNYHALHSNLNCSAGTPTQFRVTASSGNPRSVLAIYRSTTNDLLADDVESASEVSAPVIGQEHALSATSVESATEVSAPVLTDVSAGGDNLFAEDIESASEVSAPSLGQVHTLTATGTQSASEVSAPTITQIHGLTTVSIESASVVSAPNLYDGILSARRSALPGGSATGGDFTRNVTNGTIARAVRGGSIQ